MGFRFLCSLVLGAALVFSFVGVSFSQSKAELTEELNQARKDWIAQRDKLHDQDRTLRIEWHKQREELFKQSKVNPDDQSIKDAINKGAKEFFANKKAVYEQLDQLRKDFYQTRKELGAKIKAAE